VLEQFHSTLQTTARNTPSFISSHDQVLDLNPPQLYMVLTKVVLLALAQMVPSWEELVSGVRLWAVKRLLLWQVFAGRNNNEMRGRDCASKLTREREKKRNKSERSQVKYSSTLRKFSQANPPWQTTLSNKINRGINFNIFYCSLHTAHSFFTTATA